MLDSDSERRSCEIQVDMAGDAAVLRILGHITETDADAISKALDGLFEEGHYRLVFDLTDVSYMTSSGLGQIMRAYRVTRDHDGFARIVNPQSLVSDIFRITKLNHIFEIYPDLDTALDPDR